MIKAKLLGQKNGNVITYILIAIFLLGLLTLAVTEGPKKSAITMQLDQAIQGLSSDLETLEAAITQCTLLYPTPIDIDADGDTDLTDNPNPPFPLTYRSISGYAPLGVYTRIICPGVPPTPLTIPTVPTASQYLFTNQNASALKVIGNTAIYTTNYVTTTTEGVYIEVLNTASGNTLWPETVTRINARLSPCKAAVVTSGSCSATNPCLYYWIKRPATSTIGMPEAGCTL